MFSRLDTPNLSEGTGNRFIDEQVQQLQIAILEPEPEDKATTTTICQSFKRGLN